MPWSMSFIRERNKVVQNEKRKKLHGFSYSKSMANFEAFCGSFSSSTNLIFLMSDIESMFSSHNGVFLLLWNLTLPVRHDMKNFHVLFKDKVRFHNNKKKLKSYIPSWAWAPYQKLLRIGSEHFSVSHFNLLITGFALGSKHAQVER